MRLSVSHAFLPKHSSVRASQVMDHFGIDFEQGRHVIAESLDLPIQPGQVVLFSGASGSGKSSLMRAAAAELSRVSSVQSPEVRPESSDNGPGPILLNAASDPTAALDSGHSTLVSLDSLPLPDSLLIDALGLPADEAMNLLATCGLGEAHLMLRTPAELSDGQRYRFRLALALAQRPAWIIADEFTATLDRTLAKVIAFNVRRLADRTRTGCLLATTHEDVAADLDPDVHVRCRLDGEVTVHSRDRSVPLPQSPIPNPQPLKKNSLSPPTSGSPRRPVPTGRTSLGGITAAITSASPAS